MNGFLPPILSFGVTGFFFLGGAGGSGLRTMTGYFGLEVPPLTIKTRVGTTTIAAAKPMMLYRVPGGRSRNLSAHSAMTSLKPPEEPRTRDGFGLVSGAISRVGSGAGPG